MKVASHMLASALLRYANALIEQNPQAASGEANRLYHNGELVVIHPAFLKAFKKEMPDMSPEETLRALSKFLSSVADGMRADGGYAASQGSQEQRDAIKSM